MTSETAERLKETLSCCLDENSMANIDVGFRQ